MNRILIAEEKHGKRYFNASTTDARDAAAFKLLSERWEQGYYDFPAEPEAHNILSEEQIELLPTEELKMQEKKKRKEYSNDVARYKIAVERISCVEKCIKEKIVNKAWALLCVFSTGEYENVYIEELESA